MQQISCLFVLEIEIINVNTKLMVFSKFIIQGENLIMAKCQFHKQLATDIDEVKGGGAFRYDKENNAFIFSGASHDFGPADLEDIKKCVKEEKVYSSSSLRRNMNKHKFFYDTQTELIALN